MAERNPQDSLKMTWRDGDRSSWTWHHYIVNRMLGPVRAANEPGIPKFDKSVKMGYIPDWQVHFWVITHALLPLAIHQGLAWYLGKNLPTSAVVALYIFAFNHNGGRAVKMMADIGRQQGYLDGDKHERDGIPDVGVAKVLRSLIATSAFRNTMIVFLAYRRSQLPTAMTAWVPLEVGVYGIVLDFWFYWYHRAMHEVEWLWRYHRTHHLTKHPNPLLSLYADAEQEFFDIVGIPFLAYISMKAMGLPMNFYDWWICHQYIVLTELWGHSGLRVHTTSSTPFSPIYKFFNVELIIEDHDLHHRKGWKNSYNYGKQTRVWDRIFGTCHERIEATNENVDWKRPVNLWWW